MSVKKQRSFYNNAFLPGIYQIFLRVKVSKETGCGAAT